MRLTLLLLATLLTGTLYAQEGGALPEARGTWVLDSRLGSAAQIDALMKRLAEAGFNLAYVRTWYDGATIYPSAVVEAAGGRRQHAAFAGRDPLAEAIEAGARYGIGVAAWMEYGLATRITVSTNDPGPLLRAHPDWRMVSQAGDTVLAHGNGTFSYWMDPAHPEVVAFQAALAAEVAGRYPALVAFEADRIRYPDLTWSYSAVSRARYQDETGQPDPTAGSATYGPWRDWRRAQTTHLMGVIYRAVKAANPSVAVTSAVVPPYMIGTDQDKLQLWPAWADSGYVDFLEPMLYTSDRDYPLFLDRVNGLLGEGFPYYAGIDVKPSDSRYDVAYQIAQTRQKGGAGVTLWYEGVLDDATLHALEGGPFVTRVRPPHDDLRTDDADAAAFSSAGAWAVQQGGYLGTHRVLPDGSAGIARWRFGIARAGLYDVEMRWPLSDAAGTGTVVVTALGSGGKGDAADLFVDQRLADGGNGYVRDADGWVRLATRYLTSPDSVSVELGRGSTLDGTLVADAVRLVRSVPFEIAEALPVTPEAVLVRFSYPVGDLSRATFALDGEVVTASSTADPAVVRLAAAGLAEGTDYRLTVADVFSSDGRALAAQQVTLRYDPAATRREVDDADAGFRAYGTWDAAGTGAPFVGSGARTADAVTANRVYWTTTLPADGLYTLDVHLPEGAAGTSARAGYLVGHAQGFDTLYVDQAASPGGWVRLGTFEYRAGGTGLAWLYGGLSAPGALVADAIRWQRTLVRATAVDDSAAPVPSNDAPLMLAPNPARDRVRVTSPVTQPATVTVALYDLQGRCLLSQTRTVGAGTSEVTLDLEAFAPGVYFVRSAAVPLGRGAPMVATHPLVLLR